MRNCLKMKSCRRYEEHSLPFWSRSRGVSLPGKGFPWHWRLSSMLAPLSLQSLAEAMFSGLHELCYRRHVPFYRSVFSTCGPRGLPCPHQDTWVLDRLPGSWAPPQTYHSRFSGRGLGMAIFDSPSWFVHYWPSTLRNNVLFFCNQKRRKEQLRGFPAGPGNEGLTCERQYYVHVMNSGHLVHKGN